MAYAIVIDGQVSKYPASLQEEFPNTSWPLIITDECLPENWVKVIPVSAPTLDYTQKAVETTPIKVGENWVQWWETVELLEGDVTEALNGLRATLSQQVNVERDRRFDAGFVHNGHVYQSRSLDRENITGANTAALMARMAGAQAGDYRWATPDADFVWITEDNSLVPMDVLDVAALFKRGMEFKTSLTFFARELKDAINASDDPQGLFDAAVWPE